MLLSMLNVYLCLLLFPVEFAILLFVGNELNFFFKETKIFKLDDIEQLDGFDTDLEGFLRLVNLEDFFEEELFEKTVFPSLGPV